MTTSNFSGYFPSLEKELVEEIFKVAVVKDIQPGEVLMRSGQNIRSAILVAEGLIKIYREDDDGNEFFMYYLEQGSACAISLVCVMGKETSALAAKAITASTVLTIPVQYVDEWMGKYKSWTQFVVQSYRDRFDELLQTVDQVAFRNMDERLVFYLKRHQETLRSNIITTSFTGIAQDLNSSREVISRLMKKLSEKGLVQIHRSHVEIIDLDKALT